MAGTDIGEVTAVTVATVTTGRRSRTAITDASMNGCD